MNKFNVICGKGLKRQRPKKTISSDEFYRAIYTKIKIVQIAKIICRKTGKTLYINDVEFREDKIILIVDEKRVLIDKGRHDGGNISILCDIFERKVPFKQREFNLNKKINNQHSIPVYMDYHGTLHPFKFLCSINEFYSDITSL